MTKLLLASLLVVFSVSGFAAPDWTTDMKKACKSSELCAVGTGDTRSVSERNARVALSKIFDTKISSKLATSLKSTGAEVEEAVSEDINEATETALSGVEIKKSHEDKTSFYSLAVVNKAKAASGFQKEIQNIDGQMKAIAKDGESIEKVKLGKLFVKREVLNKQYQFLTGKSIDSPISYEEIFAAKRDASNNVVIHVYLDEDEPKTVEAALVRTISDMGFQATSGQTRNKNSTHIITGEYVSDKQYLNVEGFEKYKFVLKIKAMKADTKVESGHLDFEVVETGRNYSQANDKAIPKFQEYIKNNIENLNLR
jgi:hypothetical protein